MARLLARMISMGRFARAVRCIEELGGISHGTIACDVDHARRPAARIASNPGLIHLLEPDRLDSLAVEEGLRAAELQEYRVVGRVGIELLARERSLVVSELIGRPPA
jgi:hypothetical protein